jgi:2,3-diaminopropionate biosynthesis protein SbnB
MHHRNDPSRRSLMILGAHEVAAQLEGRERELIDLAAQAYVTHGRGDSRLPQSEYLRFPGLERERIIPKAGYLGGPHPAAGIKWISSFPDNVARGLPRASALIVLNCLETGRPSTVMEGSLISGQRTAAGAALAARLLHVCPQASGYGAIGVVGCGPISSETLRFILADTRPVAAIHLFDLDAARMQALAQGLKERGFKGEVVMARSVDALLAPCELMVFGTSAVQPSVSTLALCPPHATVLHVSLRDLSVEAVLQADNLADDIDHVLQANTSVHRAEQQLGRRDFLRATLAQVIEGQAAPRVGHRPVVYHPFGLAALDLAFAQHVAQACATAGRGVMVPDFLV